LGMSAGSLLSSRCGPVFFLALANSPS
jgi:hypothetical protein